MRRKNRTLEKVEGGSRDEGHRGKIKECIGECEEGHDLYKHTATI
jgi:hypothetical protein